MVERKNDAMVQGVLQAEERRRQALLAADVAALQTLLADGLVYVHSTAVSDSKASYLAKLQSASLKYLSLHFEDFQVRVLGHCAVVTGRMSAEVSKDGQSKRVCSMFMTVWSTDDDVGGAPALWTLQAHQGTPLPA